MLSLKARWNPASTGKSPPSAPTSVRTWVASSAACSPSSWRTAAGTARPPTAPRAHRSTPRSAFWRHCSNMSGPAMALRKGSARGCVARNTRSSGAAIERDRKGGAVWTRLAFPTWWHYDILRGLEYLRSASAERDSRLAEAVDLVAAKPDSNGRWLLETLHPGVMPVDTDAGEGQPSRWNTLRALRVLKWYWPEH